MPGSAAHVAGAEHVAHHAARLVHEALRALHRDDAGGVLPAVLQQQQRVVDQLVDRRPSRSRRRCRTWLRTSIQSRRDASRAAGAARLRSATTASARAAPHSARPRPAIAAMRATARQRRKADDDRHHQQHEHAAHASRSRAPSSRSSGLSGVARTSAAPGAPPGSRRSARRGRCLRTSTPWFKVEPGCADGDVGAKPRREPEAGEIGGEPAGQRQQLEHEAAHRGRRAPKAPARPAARCRPSRWSIAIGRLTA